MLALRLSEIIESAPPPTPVQPPGTNDSTEDAPGFVEAMAEMEQALPSWLDTIQQFAGIITLIGEQTSWASNEMTASDARGGGFAGRVRVTEELASRLADPVETVDALGAKYWAELASIDPGVISFVRQAADGDLSVEDRNVAQDFFRAVNELADVTRETTENLRGFSDSVAGAAEGSRLLRPQFRTIQSSVQKVIDSQTIIDEWVRLIGETDLKDNR